MGIYNTIEFRCPRCSKQLNEQSKALDGCSNYSCDKTPVEIAESIIGKTIWCYECGKEWLISEYPNKKTIPLRLVELV